MEGDGTMFVANKDDHSVLAIDATRESKYTCPGCGQFVILRHGQTRLSHFAHHAGANCEVFSEGETQAHLTGKTRIFNWCRKNHLAVKLEAYLPELHQRPDILVNWHHHWTAIEFQCSPISLEKLSERTRGYYEHGYKVWWILGPTYLARKLTLEKLSKFSYFQKSLNLFISFYNPTNDQFLVKHHLTQDLFGKIRWVDYNFVPDKKAFNELFRQDNQYDVLKSYHAYREALELQRRLLGRYTDPRLRKVQNFCYLHHLNLAGCPWLIHGRLFEFPTGVTTPLEIKVRFLVKLTQVSSKRSFSYQEFFAWFEYISGSSMLKFPNVARQKINVEMNFQQFLAELLSNEVVQLDHECYRINKLPCWYRDLTQKLNFFRPSYVTVKLI